MGILSSLYTGISGLGSQGEALSVFGDNIANSGTNGFKAARPEFQDVIARSMGGASDGTHNGRGTKLAAINPVFSQGSITQTESATDLAISGEGFFITKGNDGQGYTRNGAFHFNKEGKLVNSEGQQVQGFLADDSGKITSRMASIGVDRAVIDAKPSSEVKMFMNLDLRAEAGKLQFDPKRPDQTSNFATGVTVYDSAGTAHVVTLYFNKEGDGEWRWRAMGRGEEVVGGVPGEMKEQATGVLKFDVDGRLAEQKVDRNAFNFNKGAIPDQEIIFNFGEDKKSGGSGLSVTQYGTGSETYKSTQDGYTAGTLGGLAFDDKGVLSAVYSNGQSIPVAQVAIARFENPEGLTKIGSSGFKETPVSGSPTIGAPQSGGRGMVSSRSLESSTTDIAKEFINLMTSQRAFEANSRVVSVADQMMQEVLNLKRS